MKPECLVVFYNLMLYFMLLGMFGVFCVFPSILRAIFALVATLTVLTAQLGFLILPFPVKYCARWLWGRAASLLSSSAQLRIVCWLRCCAASWLSAAAVLLGFPSTAPSTTIASLDWLLELGELCTLVHARANVVVSKPVSPLHLVAFRTLVYLAAQCASAVRTNKNFRRGRGSIKCGLPSSAAFDSVYQSLSVRLYLELSFAATWFYAVSTFLKWAPLILFLILCGFNETGVIHYSAMSCQYRGTK